MPSSAAWSTICARTRSMAGKVRLDHSAIWYCAAMPSMSCTEPWTAIPRSAFLTCLTSFRPKGGEMANEKVDVVIVGAGASGSVFAAVLTKAGKKVVILEQGPDWQLSDLISSDFWGRRLRTVGAPFLLEWRNAYGYSVKSGWGVGWDVLIYFVYFIRHLPIS